MNTILITGANKGLGLELVKQYSDDNWQVIATARENPDRHQLEALSRSSENIRIFSVDVTQPTNIKDFSSKLAGVPIDILFNNAGIWGEQDQSINGVNPEIWVDVFKTNTIAPFLMAQAFLNNIQASKLKIIANMSSKMGSIADNSSGNEYEYRSSKAALNVVTKGLSVDLLNKGITVVSLHPGWVKTDMGGSSAPLTPTESVKGIKQILSKLSIKDTGSFVGFNGERIPW